MNESALMSSISQGIEPAVQLAIQHIRESRKYSFSLITKIYDTEVNIQTKSVHWAAAVWLWCAYNTIIIWLMCVCVCTCPWRALCPAALHSVHPRGNAGFCDVWYLRILVVVCSVLYVSVQRSQLIS